MEYYFSKTIDGSFENAIQKVTEALKAEGLAMGSEATVDINPFFAGVLTIGFIYGAFMTETFPGAPFWPFPKARRGRLGFWHGPHTNLLRITAPQMVRYALPSFTNNWLVLIKATALVSLIGLQEMTYLAKQASAATRSPFAFFLFTAALFLIYTTVSLLVLRRLNARYSLGTKRCSCNEFRRHL